MVAKSISVYMKEFFQRWLNFKLIVSDVEKAYKLKNARGRLNGKYSKPSVHDYFADGLFYFEYILKIKQY